MIATVSPCTPVDVSPAARRGPLSAWVVDRVFGGSRPSPVVIDDPMSVDAQVALYLCYESHFGVVAPAFDSEWDPQLIEFRRRLEQAFER